MIPTQTASPLDFSPGRLPARDALGHVIHPALEDLAENFDLEPQLRARGFDVAYQTMDDTQIERFVAQNTLDCSWWSPQTPEGKHWSLVLIAESEQDGPVAVFARPYRLSPTPPIVSWGLFERPLDYPDGALARAFHGDCPTSITVRGADIDELLAHLPRDLTYIPRQAGDPPFLVCTGIGTETADLSVCG